MKTVTMYVTCTECGRELIPQRTWRAADSGDRQQWRRENKRPAKLGSMCEACYTRRKRAANPKPNPKPKATPKAKRKRPAPKVRVCSLCPTTLTEPRVKYCDPCRRDRAKHHQQHQNRRSRERTRAAREAAGMAFLDDGSPLELVDGRWVLDPKTRIRKWVPA